MARRAIPTKLTHDRWPARFDAGSADGIPAAMKYKVALFPFEGGWTVGCPSLPGCHSEGKTEAEALTNIGEAIREYLEVKLQLLAKEGLC